MRSKYLPGGLHGCEGAAVSVTALGSFRSAIARAVWSQNFVKRIPPDTAIQEHMATQNFFTKSITS